ALLYWLAYKPVLRMLEERRQQIAQGLANTEKINAALAAIETQRKEAMTVAQAEATRLIEEARGIARRVTEQETQRARAAAEQLVLKARDAAELWRLSLVNGSLDENRARLVVERVIESRHTGKSAILSQFLRLVRLDRARHAAQVASAAPLDADTRAAVEEGLARRYGRAIATTFVVDPTLLAGL